jgi:hypothetical protein
MSPWSEIAAVGGVVVAIGGLVFTWFKHGFETQSQREQRYRFCKEFFDDLRAVTAMHPVQLQRGYEGLRGPRGRSAGEIRHVLELSSSVPSVIAIHRRAALGQVKFDGVLRQFSWTGWHRCRPFRWVINVVGSIIYIVGPYLGFYLVHAKYEKAASPLTVEFAVQAVIASTYFVALPIFGLIYVIRMSESARLVRLSQSYGFPVMHQPKRLRSVLRSARVSLKSRISTARSQMVRRFALHSVSVPLPRSETDEHRRPN